MGLRVYQTKRDFQTSPEPKGTVRRASGNSFCIQQHDATRMHYDFRLELDGVLKSWAVPKGPSLRPGEKRLAVEVEDHPVDYGSFEGIIPAGHYGAGPVLLWDRGKWHPVGDPHEGLRKGHIKFTLEGEKLRGGFALIRIRSRSDDKSAKTNWLLVKEDDDNAQFDGTADIVQQMPQSVSTGRVIGDIGVRQRSGRKPKKSSATPARPASSFVDVRGLPGAQPGLFPAKPPEFTLPTLVTAPPGNGDWLYEIKFDGYRILCTRRQGKIQWITRRGHDWSHRFGSLNEAVAQIAGGDFILDGEVVAADSSGHASFNALQRSLSEDLGGLVYHVFDLLYIEGTSLMNVPLEERKSALASLLKDVDSDAVRYTEHVKEAGSRVIEQACRLGLEGVIAKRTQSTYVTGRTKEWVKLKCKKRQEFVVVGFTDPKGANKGIGALLLGVRDKETSEPKYVSRVGTGFTTKSSLDLLKRLKRIETRTPAPRNAPRGKGIHWVVPNIVVEVEYAEWPEDGALRHASFQGIREDKTSEEVVREEPSAPPNAKTQAARTSTPSSKKRGLGKAMMLDGVRLTNPDRVLFEDQGLTKRDLAQYYEQVASFVLPHVQSRLLTIVRCPMGIEKQCFYQKHASDKPSTTGLIPIEVPGESNAHKYFAIDSLQGLVSLVQLGAVEIHTWGSRSDNFEHPDQLVFDLDPDEGLAWDRVVEASFEVKGTLDQAGLRSFPKTTGGKGVHVVVPIVPKLGWDEAKAFCLTLAQHMTRKAPARYTASLSKARRKGKIFIDYLRNGRGATAVAVLSPRARGGATVSMPLTWDALASLRDPKQFNVRSAPAILAKDGTGWPDFDTLRQRITEKSWTALRA